MKELQNTIYVISPEVYLSLDGKNVVLKQEGETDKRFPLHMIESIISFSYHGASPALMGYCAEHGIGLSFCKANGRILARISGPFGGKCFAPQATVSYG